jgi:hypothetical protein
MMRMFEESRPPQRSTSQQDAVTPRSPAVELVADYSSGSMKPEVILDWDRLAQGQSWAQLTVQDPQGETHDVPLALEETSLRAISSIGDRYRQGAALLETRSEEFPSYVPALGVARKSVSSPSDKVNDLLRWQQFIDTVEALKSSLAQDRRWDALRPKLVARVNLLYVHSFGMLRDQLRNQRGGEKTVQVLLESQNEMLIDIGLRLVALESGLADSAQDALIAVYLEQSLSNDIRSRAYSRLHQASQRLAAALFEDMRRQHRI